MVAFHWTTEPPRKIMNKLSLTVTEHEDSIVYIVFKKKVFSFLEKQGNRILPDFFMQVQHVFVLYWTCVEVVSVA